MLRCIYTRNEGNIVEMDEFSLSIRHILASSIVGRRVKCLEENLYNTNHDHTSL